jgi:micrococcal nuclease
MQVRAQGAVFEVFEARVSRVFDGDTLWVKPLAGGRVRKLRLDGLDAPEICQAGGTASREALASRVLKQVVTVRVRGFDVYDRALVRIEHRGHDVGAAMVLDGHAWTYRWQNDPGLYAAEEALARGARKGVFAEANAETPSAFRRRYGPCLRN